MDTGQKNLLRDEFAEVPAAAMPSLSNVCYHLCMNGAYHLIIWVYVQVTNMARQMVVNYGFSDIGPWSLLDPSAQSGDMIMRMMARNGTSESLQRRIDEAVKKIATEAYEVALTHIRCANPWQVLHLNDASTHVSSAAHVWDMCTPCAPPFAASSSGYVYSPVGVALKLLQGLHETPGTTFGCGHTMEQHVDPACVVLHRNNREAIDKIVELLQERETIDGKEFRDILGQYTQIPEANNPAEKTAETVLA